MVSGPDEPPSRRDFELLYRSVERLTQTIEALPDKMAALYVRLDNYERDQRIHDHTHIEQEKDISGLQEVVKWVIGFVFAGVGGALLAVVLR
jgi:hypothetical protein